MLVKNINSLGIFLLTLHKERVYQWTEPPSKSLEENLGDDYERAIVMLRDELKFIEKDHTQFSKWSLTQAGIDHIAESAPDA